MGNIAFLIAFIVIPIIALWRLKSVTWTLVVTFLSVGFVGAFVQVSAAFGTRWTMVGLQWALTAAMLVVLVVAVAGRNPRPVPWRIQVSSLLLPSAAVLAAQSSVRIKQLTLCPPIRHQLFGAVPGIRNIL